MIVGRHIKRLSRFLRRVTFAPHQRQRQAAALKQGFRELSSYFGTGRSPSSTVMLAPA